MLFKTGKQFICKDDRIVLLGPNGAGKTRLVAMLRQAIENPETAQAGIKATQSLVLGYCDQALADLADTDTPMHTIVRRFDVGDQRARALLAGSGLSIEMQSRPIGRLSGGQKARLGMLVLRLAAAKLLSARRADQPSGHRGTGSAGGRIDGRIRQAACWFHMTATSCERWATGSG